MTPWPTTLLMTLATTVLLVLEPGVALSGFVDITAGPKDGEPFQPPIPPDPGLPLPGDWPIPEGSAVEVDLWLIPDAGAESADPNTVCTSSASGSETCGFEIHFEAKHNMTFESFTPNPDLSAYNMVYGPASLVGAKKFKLNGYNVADDPRGEEAERLKLGTLVMDTTLSNTSLPFGELVVNAGRRVGAGLELESIQQQTVSNVPEPAQLWLLACGVAGLAALGRGRTRD